jgi:hypothetical protein
MFKSRSLCLPLALLLILCVSAAAQQPLTQDQIRHVNKVRKKLAHFDIGTKLDVQLSDGTHQIGMLNQNGSTSFVLVDPTSSKSEAIDYLDVKRVQPTRKEYMAQQLGKTANGLPKVAVAALLFLAAIAVYWVVVK